MRDGKCLRGGRRLRFFSLYREQVQSSVSDAAQQRGLPRVRDRGCSALLPNRRLLRVCSRRQFGLQSLTILMTNRLSRRAPYP